MPTWPGISPSFRFSDALDGEWRAFHRAYLSATQQAFLEGHELAFRHFGGVFRLLRYDNLTSAVRKVLRGRLREETERFIALRSHWHFEADFCTPGAGHEKGGVEGENGYFRRNHWVPVPKAANFEVLNDLLLMRCREDEGRLIDGRTQLVGQAMAEGAEGPDARKSTLAYWTQY